MASDNLFNLHDPEMQQPITLSILWLLSSYFYPKQPHVYLYQYSTYLCYDPIDNTKHKYHV